MNNYARGYLDALQEIEMEHPPGIAEHEIQARREAFIQRMQDNELRNARIRIEKKYKRIRENGWRLPIKAMKQPLTCQDVIGAFNKVDRKPKS